MMDETIRPSWQLIGALHRRVQVGRTIHALPFAAVGAFLARDGLPTWIEAGFLTLAVVFGRGLTVSLNRFFSAPEDVANPGVETVATDAAPTPRPIWALFAIHAAVCQVFCAWILNPLAAKLAAAAAGVQLLAALMRRRTGLGHLLLGSGLGAAPAGAWIACDGPVDERFSGVAVLGLGIALWAAGLDILHSLQPRLRQSGRPGAYSLPMSISASVARRAALTLQVAAFVIMAIVPYWIGRPGPWAAGIGGCLVSFAAATRILLRHRDENLPPAFLTISFAVGPALLMGTLIEVFW